MATLCGLLPFDAALLDRLDERTKTVLRLAVEGVARCLRIPLLIIP